MLVDPEIVLLGKIEVLTGEDGEYNDDGWGLDVSA